MTAEDIDSAATMKSPNAEALVPLANGTDSEQSSVTINVTSEVTALPISSYQTDFCINVTNNKGRASYLVCAAIVLTMCPTILDETGREKALESRTCELKEHEPGTVRLVLEIAHGHFFTLPAKITFDMLVSLALTAEELLLTPLLKPVIQHWALPFVRNISEDRIYSWLRIAWTFGFENVFKACLNTLVVDSHYDDSYGLLLEGDVISLNMGLPGAYAEELTAFINCARQARMHKLSMVLKNFSDYNYFMETAGCEKTSSLRSQGARECTIQRYGAFQAAVTAHFDTKRNDPDAIYESFKDCVQQLLQIESTVIVCGQAGHKKKLKVKHVASNQKGHEDCGFQAFRDAICNLCTPSELNISYQEWDFGNHFDAFKAQDQTLGGMQEYFGSALDTHNGLFRDTDIPSIQELRENVKLATQRALAKKRTATQEEDVAEEVSVEDVEVEAEVDETKLVEEAAASGEQSGPLVQQDTAATCVEDAAESGRTPDILEIQAQILAEAKHLDNHVKDEHAETKLDLAANVDHDDSGDSDYSIGSDDLTEPEEEYTSDTEQIMAARQLREIDAWRQQSLKRTFVDLVDSEDEGEYRGKLKKRKKGKAKAKA